MDVVIDVVINNDDADLHPLRPFRPHDTVERTLKEMRPPERGDEQIESHRVIHFVQLAFRELVPLCCEMAAVCWGLRADQRQR